MNLKISSPEAIIFEGEILKATIPVENGAITVLPGHAPLVSVVKPGLVSIRSDDLAKEGTFDYIFGDTNKIHVSVSKGIIFLDGKNINIVTSAATKSPQESEQELTSMKIHLEQKIVHLREQGSIEEVEKWLIDLKKIEADIELAKIKEKNNV